MEQSPSWEANRFSASQDIPRISWNSKARYRVYNNPPPFPILDTLYLRGWAFSHRCWWRSVSFGMLHRVAWYIVPTFRSRVPLSQGPVSLTIVSLSPNELECGWRHNCTKWISILLLIRNTFGRVDLSHAAGYARHKTLSDKTFNFNVFLKSFFIPNKLRKMFSVLY